MDVKILIFPETKVAAIEHHGSPALEYDTTRKLIAWKIERRLLDQLKYRSYVSVRVWAVLPGSRGTACGWSLCGDRLPVVG